jgi:hypothetical protein
MGLRESANIRNIRNIPSSLLRRFGLFASTISVRLRDFYVDVVKIFNTGSVFYEL